MILVTGGAGYIGSHCVLALLDAGYKVIIFDNLSTGHQKTVETLQQCGDVKFINGDLLNIGDLKLLFSQNQIRAVMHFAAVSQVNESVKDPRKYYINNVCGTLNLLDSMLENGIKNIVFSSTAATYGEPQYIPIDEKHPQKPVNPYGSSKLMIETILDDYDKAYGIKSVKLRYFNAAGADNKCRIGEWHEPETHLIPNILKSVFSKGQPFEMFGDDYPTKDGTCVRDYIDVEDLASAHLLALEYLTKGGETNSFNLGTKEGNTVKEVFKTCEAVCRMEIPVNKKPRREGDPVSLIADNRKAEEILGWKPVHSLEESVKSAYCWEGVQHDFHN